MKKYFFIIFIIIIVFVIYYLNINKDIYYVSIGDYLSYGINNFNKVDNNYNTNLKNKYNIKNYINYSSLDDYRIMDLINDINNNKKIIYNNKEFNFQNVLIKANLIILSIGMNDLIYSYNIDYDYLDEFLIDINSLLSLLRKYSKDRILFLGYYNIIDNNDYIKYINNKTKKICQKNNVEFINIEELNNYIINKKYPTNDGYSYITDKIIEKIEL